MNEQGLGHSQQQKHQSLDLVAARLQDLLLQVAVAAVVHHQLMITPMLTLP